MGSDRFCAACGTPLSGTAATARADPLLETLRTVTRGLYDIHGELGRGGMSAVYLAYHIRLERKVAIKVMLPQLMLAPGMADRFMQEARTSARLDHANIVRIFDVSPPGELLYFVMALVEGATAEEILHASQAPHVTQSAPATSALGVEEVCWIAYGAAQALIHAGAEGVIHRDVKPANILVNTRGDVVLSDFGIAKVADAMTVTGTGVAVGTPAYMSPEQVTGRALSSAADQYSLGVVLYELLSGVKPFTGAVVDVQYAHVHQRPIPIAERAPWVPASLAELVDRMLQKQPADRWPSLDDVSEILSSLPGSRGGAARASLARRASALQAVRVESVSPTPRSPVPIVNDQTPERVPRPQMDGVRFVAAPAREPTPTPTPVPVPTPTPTDVVVTAPRATMPLSFRVQMAVVRMVGAALVLWGVTSSWRAWRASTPRAPAEAPTAAAVTPSSSSSPSSSSVTPPSTSLTDADRTSQRPRPAPPTRAGALSAPQQRDVADARRGGADGRTATRDAAVAPVVRKPTPGNRTPTGSASDTAKTTLPSPPTATNAAPPIVRPELPATTANAESASIRDRETPSTIRLTVQEAQDAVDRLVADITQGRERRDRIAEFYASGTQHKVVAQSPPRISDEGTLARVAVTMMFSKNPGSGRIVRQTAPVTLMLSKAGGNTRVESVSFGQFVKQ